MINPFNNRIQLLLKAISAAPDHHSKLDIWANIAADICHDIATSNDEHTKVDRFFYAFQSPPIESPKFLIIAFNPADGYETTYEIGCRNEKRKYERISGKELKEPNMSWHNHQKWRLWQNLKKSFITTELNGLLNSFVYMNLVYFGSGTVNSFNKNSGATLAKQVCTELTNILVFEIFKPQVILCLGVESFAGIGNGFEQTQVNTSPINFNVKSKHVNQTLVIGIPHSSGARNGSDELRINMGEALHDLIFKTPITSENRVNSLQMKFDKFFLNELLSHIRSSEVLSELNISEGRENGGNIRYIVDGYDNDKLEITISSQGFIGIRFAKVNGHYPDNVQINKDRTLNLLKSLGFSSDGKGGNWIGKKLMNQYNTTVLNDLTDFIEMDIMKLIDRNLK